MPNKPKVRCQCGKIRRPDAKCGCGRGGARRSGWADKQRGSAASRGYGADWTRFRNAYLKRNPLCAECEKEGRVVIAEELHHLVPIAVDPSRRLDPTNCDGLCERCHSDATRASSHANP